MQGLETLSHNAHKFFLYFFIFNPYHNPTHTIYIKSTTTTTIIQNLNAYEIDLHFTIFQLSDFFLLFFFLYARLVTNINDISGRPLSPSSPILYYIVIVFIGGKKVKNTCNSFIVLINCCINGLKHYVKPTKKMYIIVNKSFIFFIYEHYYTL